MVVHKHSTRKKKFTSKQKKAKIVGKTRPERRGPGGGFYIVAIIILLAILGIVSSGTFYVFEQNIFSGWFTPSTPTLVDEGTPLVIVNDDIIYQEELDKQWNALPVQAKLQLTREALLEQLIQERLLLQKAAEEDIRVSTREVNEFINLQLAQSGISTAEFEELLANQGTNLQDMKTIYKKQLTIAKLFETAVQSDLNATEEEVRAYYEENKDEFYREDRVTVRHILVQVSENFNESAALERVQEIEAFLDSEDNENFCIAVENYTADFGSRDKCGEYTFARGVMVEEFENAAFDMAVGERRTVKTSFGYHIILKEENIDEGYLGLDNVLSDYPGELTVREFISQRISQQKARDVFDSYVGQLVEQADITYVSEEFTDSEEETGENETEKEETINDSNISLTNQTEESQESSTNIMTTNETETNTNTTITNKTTEMNETNETTNSEANISLNSTNESNITIY